MSFNFDLFKYIATDPTTASLAGATTVLDYYSQKSNYKKNRAYLDYQQKVLDESKAAKENGVVYNTYLEALVQEQQRQAKTERQREMSAQSVAQGAAIGQEGSAASLVARDATFKLSRIQGQANLAKQQITNKGQTQLDDLTLQYNANSLDLDYKTQNLSSPSIFSSIVDITETVYSDYNKFTRARDLEEKLINLSKPAVGTKTK